MGRYTLEIQHGFKAEGLFQHLAEARGYNVETASTSMNIKDHIDLILTKDTEQYSVDVKSRKKLHRNGDYNDAFVWVEFHNVQGKLGWLYGKADKIVFERADDFVIVDRENLKDYCETTVVPLFVDAPSDAVYKIYQRSGRKDVISLVSMENILHPYSYGEDTEIWEKVEKVEKGG